MRKVFLALVMLVVFAVFASGCSDLVSSSNSNNPAANANAQATAIIANAQATANAVSSVPTRQGVNSSSFTAATSTPEVVKPNLQPTAAPAATSVPQATKALGPDPASFEPVNKKSDVSQGKWKIQTFEGVTDQMNQWMKDLKDLDVNWPETPNLDSPSHNFKAKDGLYWGLAEGGWCQRDQTCDINIQARGYRMVTGDYWIPGVDSCYGSPLKEGCGIILINVGEVTAMYRNSKVDFGWTVPGNYFNGDAMPVTIRAALSNRAFDMLNIAGGTNHGANCSVVNGCQSVRLAFVITSGNQVLVKGVTTVSK